MVIKEREKESATLVHYLERFTESEKGFIVYISGVPGSGKTYTAKKILESTFPCYTYVN